MIILGVDPGLGRLGWSVLEKGTSGVQLKSIGIIQTASHHTLSQRLVRLADSFNTLLDEFSPNVLALETLFFVKNAKTIAQVGHARGVVLLLAGQRKLDTFEYAPRQIKLALTGYGGAEKRQMQLVVKRTLNLKSIPRPDDAADAAAVALCHAQYNAFQRKAMVTV